MNPQDRELVEAARAVRACSHSPYSGFRVGAALRGAGGAVHVGTNVENVSIGLSVCAERHAVAAGVAAGETRFAVLAVCGDGPAATAPCGACRQVLREFGPDLRVIMVGDGPDAEVSETTLAELLPAAFTDFPPRREAP